MSGYYFKVDPGTIWGPASFESQLFALGSPLLALELCGGCAASAFRPQAARCDANLVVGRRAGEGAPTMCVPSEVGHIRSDIVKIGRCIDSLRCQGAQERSTQDTLVESSERWAG